MPTPRPFNAPIGFNEGYMGEINRQVQRMQTASSSSAANQQNAKTFLNQALNRLKGLNPKEVLGVKSRFVNSGSNLGSSGGLSGGVGAFGTVGNFALAKQISDTLAPYTTQPLGKSIATNTMRAVDKFVPGGLKDSQGRDVYIDSKGKPQLQKKVSDTSTAEDSKADSTEESTTTQDPKRQSGGGLDTSMGLTFKDINEADFMNKFGLEDFVPNQNFDSNQLPTTNTSFSPEDARVMGMSDRDIQLMSTGNDVTSVFEKGKVITDPGMRAFLDYEGPGGTMGAMRAAERERGMVRIGGKNYYPNPLAGQDGQDEMIAMSEQQRRDVNAGRITVQDVGNDYINRVNGAVSVANSGYSDEDAQVMGVPKTNAEAMRKGDYVQYYNEQDFDKDKSNGTLIDFGITPFTQKLLR